MNREPLRSWLVGLWTHSNPSSSTKTELRIHSNPSKKPELQSYLARNRLNPGPNLEKQNFKPFWTQVRIPKPNTMNPPKPFKNPKLSSRTWFDPSLNLNLEFIDTNWILILHTFFFFQLDSEKYRLYSLQNGYCFKNFTDSFIASSNIEKLSKIDVKNSSFLTTLYY